MKVSLLESELSLAPLLAEISHAGAGAVDVFYGIVRNHSDGVQVTRLDYSAYDAMALAEMRAITVELEAKFNGVRLAVAHRKGTLQVGDVAVICAASAPHRAEAFEACRALIDTIKERVPIWKREYGPDGPYWVGWRDARCAAEGHAGAHDAAHPHHASRLTSSKV